MTQSKQAEELHKVLEAVTLRKQGEELHRVLEAVTLRKQGEELHRVLEAVTQSKQGEELDRVLDTVALRKQDEELNRVLEAVTQRKQGGMAINGEAQRGACELLGLRIQAVATYTTVLSRGWKEVGRTRCPFCLGPVSNGTD